jgi:hypothetical protein
MEFSEIINLFKKANKRNKWEDMSYILMYDDGSGELVSEDNLYDGDTIFEFENEKELIEKLKR